jgi:hypothetical protein
VKTLIDLSPTLRGGAVARTSSHLVAAFEAACEYLDGIGSKPFSEPELFRACWSSGAARQLIKMYLALGFIERISNSRGRRPVLYRILPHALPKQVAA